MKIVILDAEMIGKDIPFDGFLSLGEVIIHDFSTPAEIPERIRDAEVILTNKCRLSGDILAAAPRLKLILEAATGFDNIDVEYCRNHGVGVCNVKGYSSPSVATLTTAMALGLLCHLNEYDAYCRSGDYTRSGKFNLLAPPYSEAEGKTWGIVGMGDIGRRVAAVAKALGCEVVCFQRHPDAEYPTLSLEELIRRSDIISLHVPLNDGTRGMIGEKELSLLKPGAILINMARGPVVDEEAVARALAENRLGGFGCDVFSIEPFPEDHPYQKIKTLPNVILTPHMAWGSIEARRRLMNEMQENLCAFLRGERRNRID